MGKIFAIICIMSTLYGALNGNMEQLSSSIINGAGKAVNLSIALCGTMCLWCGVMSVLREAGAVDRLSSLMNPILKIIFPQASKNPRAAGAISAAISANLLGIGNAATPLAMRVMSELKADCRTVGAGVIATNDMVMFAVLSCSSLDIVPTTLIALRSAAGAADPFDIIVPVWIVSAVCAAVSVICCKAYSVFFPLENKRC